MKAIVVSAALVIVVSAGSVYADPIHSAGQNAPPGAVSGLSVHGRASNLDLAFGPENPVTLTLSGLDARQNYQDHNWSAHLGAPARLASWLEDEGWSVKHGSRFERSFLALGRSAFGEFKSGRSNSRMLRWSRIREKIKHNNKEKHRDKHDRSGDDSNDGGGGGGNDDPGDANEHDDGIPFPGDGGENQVATPEPGSMLLIGSGLIVVARQIRKRHNMR